MQEYLTGVRVIVTHRKYGCETGCCGHCVEVDGVEVAGSFSIVDHPYGEDKRKFAEEMVRKHGCDPKDLDWENCVIIGDC